MGALPRKVLRAEDTAKSSLLDASSAEQDGVFFACLCALIALAVRHALVLDVSFVPGHSGVDALQSVFTLRRILIYLKSPGLRDWDVYRRQS